MHTPSLRQCNRRLLKNHAVPCTSGVWSLNPNQNARKVVHPKLLLEYGFARVLVGTKEVPLLSNTLLLDAEVGAINCHKAIIAYVIDKMALKDDLLLGEQRWTMRQGETTTGKDMTR